VFEFELVAHGHVVQPIDGADVALEYIVGSQVLLEGLDIGGGDDLPGEVEVFQPIVVVQPLPLALQVALQVAFGEGLSQQAPKLLLGHESMRAYISPGVPSLGERSTPSRYRNRSYSGSSMRLK
jgi:hypothetical protein